MTALRADHKLTLVPAPLTRRLLPATVVVVAAVTLSSCQADSPFGAEQAPPTTLVASPVYTEGNDEAQAQLGRLQRAVDRLRADTSTAWTGRQDDVTGYLTDLSGGRWTESDGGGATGHIASFFEAFGLDLFGATYADLDVSENSSTADGTSTVRATQQLDGVPVLDGALVFSVADGAQGGLTAVRGRVFPDLSTSTDPAVAARKASGTAERLSGGDRATKPRLVVLPVGTGQLAWEITIVDAEGGGGLGLSDGLYYVDAGTGDLVDVRPSGVSFGAASLSPTKARKAGKTAVAAARAEGGEPVEVTGTGPTGEQLTAVGRQTANGIELVDTTTPTYDPATGEGGIYTFTAQDTEQSSGPIYVERGQNGGTISDPDAIAAHAWSRVVFDYYAELGRSSWDGAGGSLNSIVNFGDDTFCNAYFSHDPPQMVYGNPCRGDGGLMQLATLDVAGHEITHGVTETTAGLVYSGQPGALNEAFSDYFGNVIGNRTKGSDDSTLGEDACAEVTSAMQLCDAPTPDGGWATREMLNGNTNADYLRLLNPTLRMRVNTGYDADHGGVHLNSAIWNNALWSIRTRLAQIDGTDGNESPLAQDFDKIVYAALTTQLGPASDFVDARGAIEQVAVDAGADPTILRVARETFDQNLICTGCVDLGTVNGAVVSAAPQTQVEPAVHGDQITWVDMSQGGFGFGLPALSDVEGDARSLAASPDTTQVAFAGDSVIGAEVQLSAGVAQLVRYDEAGERSVLTEAGESTILAGIAGSDEGAAWVTTERGTVSFVDPSGQVTTEDLPDLGGDNVTALGTGQGVVGLGTENGRVLRWEPGAGFEQLGQVSGTVFSVAAYGGRVLAVDDAGGATLFDSSGGTLQLSDAAGRFGAAINGDYAVWSESVGSLGGGVAEQIGGAVDTDLYLFSFETGTIYNLLDQTGQQGYPAISGDRIAWQDTVFGGNDVMTALLPSGL